MYIKFLCCLDWLKFILDNNDFAILKQVIQFK